MEPEDYRAPSFQETNAKHSVQEEEDYNTSPGIREGRGLEIDHE